MASMTHTGLRGDARGTTTELDPAQRPYVYVNGEMLPKAQATVSVFDHGLLYGDGVFEGIRVYQGKIFKAGQHLNRLYTCAGRIHLTIPMSQDEMLGMMRACIEVNGLKDGYIRLLVTRGEGSLGLNPYLCPRAGVICIADQISLYKAEMYEKGMRVVLARRPKTPIECLDPRIKSLNYLNNILAKCEAIHIGQRLGITKPEDQLLEVIMLNLDGKLTEGSGDNLFLVKNGKVLTPPSEAGLLEGITRRFVMDQVCPAEGVTIQEQMLTLDDLYGADEVFLTGTAAEMIGVREVLEHHELQVTRSHKVSEGEGPITHRLRMRFRSLVSGPNVPED